MKIKMNISQTLNTLANIGVIAGIVFLAVELHQNNEFLELEAKTTYSEILQSSWDRISGDPDLVALFIKDRNGEALNESEEFRLNAWWMGYLLRMDWQYQNFPDKKTRLESLRRIHASYGSFRRTWEGNTNGSRAAGKDNFSPEFVTFIDETLLVGH